MPIRNEAGFIERSLGAILAQSYPHDRYEVLVADGMSTDNTRTLVASLADQGNVAVKIVDNPGKIVPTGFNAALEIAAGDVIVRVDGHCEVPTDYLDQCIHHLMQSRAECVGGVVDTIGASYIARAIALAMSSTFGVGNSTFRTMSDGEDLLIEVDTLAFGAYQREVFRRIGGYDTELVRNQDDEFNYRLRAAGGKILLNPRIRSSYFSRSSLRSLARQYYQYGLYKVRVLQKHPRQMQMRQFVPPAFTLGVIGGLMAAPFSDLLRIIWLMCLSIYLAGSMAISLRIAVREGWQYLPILPLLFSTLHLSYGAGFLVGLWKFRTHWNLVNRRID
ncbi:MAG: glycosyltransferase family 2 protein [Anaerolineae bacterium]|nr:glycosyltransferase family 2 protein [Anaerolineae bacterium]NUQ06062.1 glycosyltransferase family 2 protein [Anaerolineae bacterium]